MFNLSFKAFFIKLFLSISIIFLPLKPIMITVGILIFFDFITGVYKTWKLNKKITSLKMSFTVSKMVLYQIAIISAFLTEMFIMPLIPLSKIVSGYIALVELKSISENISETVGTNFFKEIQKYLRRNDKDYPENENETDKENDK